MESTYASYGIMSHDQISLALLRLNAIKPGNEARKPVLLTVEALLSLHTHNIAKELQNAMKLAANYKRAKVRNLHW